MRECLIWVAAAGLGLAQGCLIDSQGVAGVRLGMTAAQARRALKGAELRASQDGDGLPLLQVLRDRLHTMDLYVDEHSKIDLIRVYDGACATRDGVHPGMALGEVAKRYGHLRRLAVTEIESREFADFEKGPPWLGIQVGNGQVGVYPAGKRCTTNVSSSAHIASLWVAAGHNFSLPACP